GQQPLKNIAQPIRVYRVGPARPGQVTRPSLAPPDKPSIAVLPFTNLSGDKEQEYFSDGVTEDIITELSRFSDLFVIARNSSFQYKGKSPDIRDIGRELGVHYVLEVAYVALTTACASVPSLSTALRALTDGPSATIENWMTYSQSRMRLLAL